MIPSPDQPFNSYNTRPSYTEEKLLTPKHKEIFCSRNAAYHSSSGKPPLPQSENCSHKNYSSFIVVVVVTEIEFIGSERELLGTLPLPISFDMAIPASPSPSGL